MAKKRGRKPAATTVTESAPKKKRATRQSLVPDELAKAKRAVRMFGGDHDAAIAAIKTHKKLQLS